MNSQSARRAKQCTSSWIIVAHPDDEIIFAGCAILANPNLAWNIVISTHSADSRRGKEARAVEQALIAMGIDVRYYFLGHSDERAAINGGIVREKFVSQVSALPIARDARIFTHGADGEYGHIGHKAVHRFVCACWAQNEIWTFARGTLHCAPLLLQAKRKLFRDCYTSQAGAWKNLEGTMNRLMFDGEGHVRWKPGPRAFLPRLLRTSLLKDIP